MPDVAEMVQALLGKTPNFDERFGAVKSYLPPPPPTSYPTQADVDFARKYDMTYGRPAAGIDTPGQRMVVLPNVRQAMLAANEGKWNTERAPMSQADRDREYAAWLATNRSPLASLGYSPQSVTTTPVKADTPELTLAGFFSPQNDKLWYDLRDPDAVVHELTHRGIQTLRSQNDPSVPKQPFTNEEEYMVRALMNRHFGDVESGRGNLGDTQVLLGKMYASKHPEELNKAEAAAAREINRRHPMGPN